MNRKHLHDYQHFHSAEIYGTGGKHFPYILSHILALKPTSAIDYGAGRSEIINWIGNEAAMERVARFDPAVPGIDTIPDESFGLVTSFDVLEHIPEDELDAVLSEMARAATHALLVIDVKPAKAMLSDGRNAHVTLHDEAWWHQRLKQHFPTIRPFKIKRPHRVAFKTWEQEFSKTSQYLTELKAKLKFKLHRLRNRRPPPGNPST